MEQPRDRELAQHLAGLDTPEYDPGFFADLWLRIAEECHASAEAQSVPRPRPRYRWFGVPRWAVGTAALAAFVALVVVTVSVPGAASALHLPLGDKVAALESQELQLRQALLGQLAKQLTTTVHVVAVDGGSTLSATTPAERLLARNPAISRLVRDYYATQVLAHTPGAAGVRGRRDLAGFFPRGSAALARARYLALGTLGELAAGRDGLPAVDPTRASVAVVRDLAVDSTGTHATVVVWPAVEYQVWTDAPGRLQWGHVGGESGEPWGIAPGGAPHRLQLVRLAGRWLISDDFSLDAEIPAALRRGGAPVVVWRGEQRRIGAAAQQRFAVSTGIRTTFEQLVALLNQRRFAETGRLFADGVGLRSSTFQHPDGPWRLQLVSVWGYHPLSEQAIADPNETSVVARISGPQDLLNAGGGTLSGLWTLHRDGSGQWLITGGGAPVVGAPNPM